MTDTIHGFKLVKEQAIPELNTNARLFRHVQTGAELLSMENNDENKVFGINFPTPPTDSTGVAHIMEHSVLCGSRKYPLKEPFIELVKGSLQTFVNAITFSDKTCYPVASQNLQDFYNLIDVYMDAVLYPRISEQTLQQEGWHYEVETADAPLVYKGVVFNEMKGAYSDPDNMIGRYVQQSLFPDTTYGVDSGGNPKDIPNLTYAQFKSFHDTYYHPSNALIFFYGDDAPDERLRRMDDYLKDFQRLNVDVQIGLQPQFNAPKHFTYPYAVGQDDPAPKGMVTVNWLLGSDKIDAQTLLGLEILDYLLLGTPASPLRKALIDSGLGEDLAGGGLDAHIRQPYFSTGLKGIAVADADKVEPLIFQTLTTLVQQGIERDMVEAARNTIEFRMRELNTGAFPRGLLLMINALTTWLYGDDPVERLAFEAPLQAIKGHLTAGEHYFEFLITRYLLHNTHRTTVVLQPDAELRQREDAAEKAILARARAAMSRDEVAAAIEDTQRLKDAQDTRDTPEALATIPSLKLADLDKQNKTIPLTVLHESGAQLLYHDLFTNGLLYFDLGLNLHLLPQEYLPYAGLFGRALLELGTETEDYIKLSQRIGRKTGGIRPAKLLSAVPGNADGTAWLFLRGKATVDQAQHLLSILRDVLLTVRFDNRERFRQIVLEEKAIREAGLVPEGHIVAMTRLNAHFDQASWAAEQTGGISYLLFLRELAQRIETDWLSVCQTLEAIRHLLLNRSAVLCNVTLDAHNWERVRPQLNAFLAALPTATSQLATWTPTSAPNHEGLTIPAQVNYVAKGADLYKMGYRLHGSIFAISNYLRTTWLWERVRVQGGAYGGFCRFDPHSGVFDFVSYRDPNLLETLENYDKASQFLRELDLGERELTRSIIGAISQIDSYRLPDAKGYESMINFLVGDSDQKLQQQREEVLATTIKEFHALGEWLAQVGKQGLVVVLGSLDAINTANAARGNFLNVQKVL